MVLEWEIVTISLYQTHFILFIIFIICLYYIFYLYLYYILFYEFDLC